MKIKLLQVFRGSLFVKIVAVFGFALFLTIVFVGFVHRFYFMPPILPEVKRNAVNYARYVVDDLGYPPDIRRAREVCRRLKIRVRFEGPKISWASHEDIPAFEDVKMTLHDPAEGSYAGLNSAGLCAAFRTDKGNYFIVSHKRREGYTYHLQMFAMILLAISCLVLIGVYFFMHWLLRPVKVLDEGVRQLSAGNTDYHMNTRRRDELGQLVGSFNGMTTEIRNMIHARERLLLDVSHELRSPLTRVKVALEFLEDDSTKSAIRDDIAEMETMISELLETERLNSQYGGLTLKETDMAAALREVCAGFGDRKPGVKIVSVPAEPVVLAVDPERMNIVYRNILDNALRYSDPSGFPVEISMREKADQFIIEIQDFGAGIPEEDLPFVFEPFYRVDKSRSKETGGYGLGMNLCKKIIDHHGGVIEIVSRLDTGTTVFLKFNK